MLPLFLFLLTQAQVSPPPPEPEPPTLRRYGDAGTTHFGLTLGLGGGSGGFAWAAGADVGYFIWDGVAPGVEALVTGGTNLLTTGLTLGTLRLVPLRTENLALTLIGRAGRVYLSDHADGWGAGGGAAVIFFTGGRIGFEVGYDLLVLFPKSFCDDLSRGCRIDGLRAGIVAAF